jgi:hypothetical protein
MPASRLASESDIQGTDIILTATAILIRTMDTGTGHTTTVGHHSIGIAGTGFTIRGTIDITGVGTKLRLG